MRIGRFGRNVFADNVKTGLTAKEYNLLEFFVKNKGIALLRNRILDAV